MQDWIVGRQLTGIAGVAEVTGFGGISKQYEVAINPERLKAMNVTIPEIFTALQKIMKIPEALISIKTKCLLHSWCGIGKNICRY